MISTPKGTRTCSGVSGNRRRPDCAVCRSSTATTSPAPTRLSVPEAPRTRTSTVAGTSPSSSRPAGTCVSSSGTRSPRSTVSSPDTTIHSISARLSDSSFSQMLPNSHVMTRLEQRHVNSTSRFGDFSRRCRTSARSRART